jgi:hypothetical protein
MKWRNGSSTEDCRFIKKIRKAFHGNILEGQMRCLVSIRIKIVTYSVDSTTSNTASLFQKKYLIGFTTKGEHSDGS